MVDKETGSKTEEKKDPQETPKGKIGVITWLVIVAIVGTLSGSGYLVGCLIASPSVDTEAKLKTEKKQVSTEKTPADNKVSPGSSDGTWYYEDLDPVVVNPDEPGATRFIRVSLILEISNELIPDQAKELFTAQKPLLINWLNLYFKSMSLDEMENDKDMKRILSQICDGFNEILFPEAKPQIKKVLIREFNIQ